MMTLREFMAKFPTDEDCKQYLFEHRWPDGKVKCPRCNNEKVYKLRRLWHWQCPKCGKTGYRFSLLVGTIFENTNFPLTTWFEVLWMMLNSKKGVSALQVQRQIGTTSYKNAWYMCHRLRAAMHDDEFRKLMGIVEVDETYIGGKDKNRHWSKKSHITGGSGKATVIGAISRKGNVVCRMIENADTNTLARFVHKAVSEKVNLVSTDEHRGYLPLREMDYKHSTVTHQDHE